MVIHMPSREEVIDELKREYMPTEKQIERRLKQHGKEVSRQIGEGFKRGEII